MACMRCSCLCLCCFGMGTMLAKFHMCGIMLVLEQYSMCSWGMRVQEGLCVLGDWWFVCQDLWVVILLSLIASWTWVVLSVMLYPCILCVELLMDLFVLCVWQCLWIVRWNNLQYVWVWLLFCCWMLWKCLVWVKVLCWINHVWSSKECASCACCTCCACCASKRSFHKGLFMFLYDGGYLLI